MLNRSKTEKFLRFVDCLETYCIFHFTFYFQVLFIYCELPREFQFRSRTIRFSHFKLIVLLKMYTKFFVLVLLVLFHHPTHLDSLSCFVHFSLPRIMHDSRHSVTIYTHFSSMLETRKMTTEEWRKFSSTLNSPAYFFYRRTKK